MHRERYLNVEGLHPSGRFGATCTRVRPAILILLLAFSGRSHVALGAAGSASGPTKASIRAALSSDEPLPDRMKNAITLLRTEPVEASLDGLDDVYLFMKNQQIFMEQPRIVIPLVPSAGQTDLVAIMGNRRFLKAMDALAAMPPQEAAGLLAGRISSALEEYTRLFDLYMDAHADTFRFNLTRTPDLAVRPLGFSFTDETDEPTLIAVRHKVLALTLLAGNLGIRSTQPAVKEVVDTALRQRRLFYSRRDLFTPFDAAVMLLEASLYHREILATAVLGTYVNGQRANQILKDLDCRFTSEKLTRYDVMRTRYGGFEPPHTGPDYSGGTVIVAYADAPDDSRFDGIVRACADTRVQKATPADSAR